MEPEIKRPPAPLTEKDNAATSAGTNWQVGVPVVLGAGLFSVYFLTERFVGCQAFLWLDAPRFNALVEAMGTSGVLALVLTFLAPRLRKRQGELNDEGVRGWRLFTMLIAIAFMSWAGASHGYEQSLRKMNTGVCAQDVSSYSSRHVDERAGQVSGHEESLL